MNSVEEIQRQIKDAVEWLIDEDMGCVTIKLDDRLAICVGWLPGYGEEARDDCIQSKSEPDFAINAGLKVWTSDDMRTDYEYINMPYYENGDVIDTDISIEEKDKEDNYQHVSKWLLDQYENIKDLDIEENGLINEFSAKEEDAEESQEESLTLKEEESKFDNYKNRLNSAKTKDELFAIRSEMRNDNSITDDEADELWFIYRDNKDKFESLKEDLDLPKEVTFKASEVALDTDDENPEERLSDLLSDKYGFCHYGFKYEVKNNENGEPSEFRCYDIEWDTSESLKEDITKDSEEYKKAWIDALHNFRDAYSKLKELMTTAGFDSNEFINTKQAREAMNASFAKKSLDELRIADWCDEVEENINKWTPGQWLEESLKEERESLKETWDGENVIDDLVERAQAKVEEGQDISEAVSNAIDEGLIYTSDIYTLAQHYGSIEDGELINSFYDDLYNDVMNGIEIPEDEEDNDWDEEEPQEESLQEDNSSKGSLIAQTVAKEFKGEVGPFGGEDPEINGNEITLYGQGGGDIFRFNDDGSIDFVNVEEAVHEWVSDGEIEEDEVEDCIKEYGHFNSLEDLINSGLSWFTYLSNQTQRKVKEILSK